MNNTNLHHRTDAATRALAGESAADIASELGVNTADVELWAKEFCKAGQQRLRQMPDNFMERCITASEKLVPLATLLSVVIAVTLFIQGQRKEMSEHARLAALEREARVRDAYTSLDDRYIDYVKQCLANPDLDVYDVPRASNAPITPDQQRRESMMLSILDSVLERAYLMYANPTDDFERNQWTAWSAYMASWSGRANFRTEWARDRLQFDPSFSGYIDSLIHTSTTMPTMPVQ
ncbi:MAG: hypothetical protein JO353_06505 [Phycisphaerae bacterium]|nr:hypothetical protein [Phycisphaerae bacterium]